MKLINKMNKAEYIKESYIKEQLEKEEHNENEFYAEQYMSSLEQQHKDAEREQPKDIVLLAIETAKRMKPFVVDVEDSDYKLQRLYKLKEALKDNITLEITDTFLQMLDKEIKETKEDIQLKDFEIKQICEAI